MGLSELNVQTSLLLSRHRLVQIDMVRMGWFQQSLRTHTHRYAHRVPVVLFHFINYLARSLARFVSLTEKRLTTAEPTEKPIAI